MSNVRRGSIINKHLHLENSIEYDLYFMLKYEILTNKQTFANKASIIQQQDVSKHIRKSSISTHPEQCEPIVVPMTSMTVTKKKSQVYPADHNNVMK